MPPLLGSTIYFLGMFEIGKTYPLPNAPKPPHLPGDIVGVLVVNTYSGQWKLAVQLVSMAMLSSTSRAEECSDD